MILSYFSHILKSISHNIGAAIAFAFRVSARVPSLPKSLEELARQFFYLGLLSLPIVALTSFFTGAVLAIQSYVGFSAVMKSESIIARIVVTSITREIGPVLVGIIVAGRVASSIAAELGSMKVTDQIDALRALSIDPYVNLILPKILIGVLTFPLIVIIADFIGVFGGFTMSVYKFNFNSQLYIVNSLEFLKSQDVITGLVKAAIFGLTATAVSCFNGINCYGGAKGVGQAVLNSVVMSFILILLFNYLITIIMLNN